MVIEIGKTQVSLLDPPNDGTVRDVGGKVWNIGRNCDGAIVLRSSGVAHPEFLGGMYLAEFCQWVNEQVK